MMVVIDRAVGFDCGACAGAGQDRKQAAGDVPAGAFAGFGDLLSLLVASMVQPGGQAVLGEPVEPGIVGGVAGVTGTAVAPGRVQFANGSGQGVPFPDGGVAGAAGLQMAEAACGPTQRPAGEVTGIGGAGTQATSMFESVVDAGAQAMSMFESVVDAGAQAMSMLAVGLDRPPVDGIPFAVIETKDSGAGVAHSAARKDDGANRNDGIAGAVALGVAGDGVAGSGTSEEAELASAGDAAEVGVSEPVSDVPVKAGPVATGEDAPGKYATRKTGDAASAEKSSEKSAESSARAGDERPEQVRPRKSAGRTDDGGPETDGAESSRNSGQPFATHLEAQPAETGEAAGARATGVDRAGLRTSEIARQIVQQGRLLKFPERTEVEIRLKPEWLGRVTLRIASQEGRISARFTVGEAGAKTEIESRLGELRQGMSDQGLEVSDISVSVGDGRQWAGQRHWAPQDGQMGGNRGAAAHTGAAEPTAPGDVVVGLRARYRSTPGSLDLMA
ncbi:MAG: flagellar hook-length control protein FliK [Firmicutes bacterium]|nr:flagellar hook-length control protein FliK [Bacillota bacterium]